MTSASFRTVAVKAFSVLRDFWLIVGVCVALLFFAESCYWLQDSARGPIRAALSRGGASRPRIPHPVASEPWYPQFAKEFAESGGLAWRPYVYFRRSGAYHGRYVNVDSQRHRVTPQPSTPGKPAARVFFFGGSTMWGSFLRDEHTIPAEASKRLQTIAASGERIEVTNFGESGHVSTQGMLELILQLRTGNRPDVVVFYDGINDVFSQLQNGEPGYGLNENNRVAEFSLGRRLSWNGRDNGYAKDFHTLGVLAQTALARLAIVQRMQSAIRPPPSTPNLPIDSAAHRVASIYTENVRVIEALGREYDFTSVYVWQPTLHATDKRLTPYEARLMESVKADDAQRRLAAMHRAVLPLLDSALATVVPGRFINEGGLFRGDSMPVFSDQVGHNTETAISVIVDAFWPALQAAVAPRHAAKAAAARR